MDDGRAGYYDDLIHRVDDTVTQSRSAYGGDQAEEDADGAEERRPNQFGGRTINFHVSTVCRFFKCKLVTAELCDMGIGRGKLASLN